MMCSCASFPVEKAASCSIMPHPDNMVRWRPELFASVMPACDTGSKLSMGAWEAEEYFP